LMSMTLALSGEGDRLFSRTSGIGAIAFTLNDGRGGLL